MTDVIFDLRPTEQEETPWLTYLIVGLCGALLGACATALIIAHYTNVSSPTTSPTQDRRPPAALTNR